MDNICLNKDALNAFLESLKDYNPEVDAISEEVFEDGDLDIKLLGHMIEIDERYDSVLNTEVLKNIRTVYGLLQKELENTGVKISYELHRPYHSMGYVMVEGKSINFKNTRVFKKCMELSSNTEVYPLAKNGVRTTFTFHGLTNKIREVCEV